MDRRAGKAQRAAWLNCPPPGLEPLEGGAPPPQEWIGCPGGEPGAGVAPGSVLETWSWSSSLLAARVGGSPGGELGAGCQPELGCRTGGDPGPTVRLGVLAPHSCTPLRLLATTTPAVPSALAVLPAFPGLVLVGLTGVQTQGGPTLALFCPREASSGDLETEAPPSSASSLPAPAPPFPTMLLSVLHPPAALLSPPPSLPPLPSSPPLPFPLLTIHLFLSDRELSAPAPLLSHFSPPPPGSPGTH